MKKIRYQNFEHHGEFHTTGFVEVLPLRENEISKYIGSRH